MHTSTKAIKDYAAALKMQPRSALALFNSGILFLRLEKPEEATRVWLRLIQETPPSQMTAMAQVELAKFQLAIKSPEGVLSAIRLFQGAVKADSTLASARDGLEESLFNAILASLPGPGGTLTAHESILKLAQIAKTRLREGNPMGYARRCVVAAQNVGVTSRRGRIMLEWGIEAAKLGYERAKGDIEAVLLYTRALSAGGQQEAALELLRVETKSRPNEPRMRAEASRTLYQLERSQESIQEAKVGRILSLNEAKALHSRCVAEGGGTSERASQCRDGAYQRAVALGKTGERVEAYGHALVAVGGEPQASNRTYRDIWDLSEAEKLEDDEDYTGAIACLQRVLAPGGRTGHEYAHMKLANLLAAEGDGPGSVAALGMGFSHPLHGAVAHPDMVERPGTAAAKDGSVSLFDGALPGLLLRDLREAFRDNAPFWRAHNYPSSGYFSYYFPMDKRAPINIIESTIKHHLLPLVRRGFGHTLDNSPHYVGAEWWVHKRVFDNSSKYTHGHVLHFDSDQEAFYKRGVKRLSHVSSVMYLAGEVGGPTLVIPETVDEHQTKPAKEAWRVKPGTNRYAVFPGQYLHGVLPSKLVPVEDSVDGKRGQRLTLLVAFWEEEGCTSPLGADGTSEAGKVGPCMTLPTDVEDSPWLHDVALKPGLDPAKIWHQAGERQAPELAPVPVAPVWF